MRAQPSSRIITGQPAVPANMGHAVPGVSPAYQEELNTWARSQTYGAVAVGKIMTWLALGDTSRVLDLASLSLTSLPSLPGQLRKLSAADNKLVYLPENLPLLEALDVSDNALTRLPEALFAAGLKMLNARCNKLVTVPWSYHSLYPGCEIYLEGNTEINPRVPDGCFCDLPYLQALRTGDLARVKAMLSAFPQAATCVDKTKNMPLFIASALGHVEIVTLLLQLPGIDVNRRGSIGAPPLIAALTAGHENIALLLLERYDTDPNSRTTAGGSTALHVAVKMKHYEAAKSLLQRPDLNPNLTHDMGKTALHRAIDNGDETAVGLLLACPMVDIRQPDSEGMTPIAQAGATGHLALVEALLQKMAVNQEWQALACTEAMCQAIVNGHTKIVALILKKYRSDPDIGEAQKKIPPVGIAISFGRLEILKLLLFFNADVNVRLPSGAPMLTAAIAYRRLDIFKVLLFHPNVDPNIQDVECGDSPLGFAVSSGSLDFVKLLLEHKAVDVNHAVDTGVTPLLSAVAGGNAAMLQCLLSDKRLLVNKAGRDGSTALITSCRLGNEVAVKLLLQHDKIDLYAKQEGGGGSALQLAVATARFDIIRLLMRAMDDSEKAKIEAADGLVIAIHAKSIVLIELLVALGANPNQRCSQRLFPLEFFGETSGKQDGHGLTGRLLICLLKAGARIDRVRTLDMQRKLANAVGSHVIEVLSAATEPLKRQAGDETSSLMTARGAQAIQHIKDAKALLTTIAGLDHHVQAMLLAGVALASAAAFDLILDEHAQLKKLIDSVCGATEIESKLKCMTIHMYMKVWDGSGIDAAGQGSFSVLQTERDRLPSGTRSILAAWKL